MREQEIKLAPDYPYPPLEAGECIINSGILVNNPDLKIGDTINIEFGLKQLIKTMSVYFNNYVKEPGAFNVRVNNFSDSVPCVIKEIMGEPYGKYLTSREEFQVIMEFNELFPYVLDYVDDDADIWHDRQDFLDYLSTPQILEQYA